MSSNKILFIGLGVMGYPMAGWLHKAGYDVTVYNRTKEVSEKWVDEYKGKSTRDYLKVACEVDFVVSCIGKDSDLQEVFLGEKGVITVMQQGSIVVDHTTASSRIAKEIYDKGKEKGVAFIDAPISGGQQGAQKGQLTIMCGGDESAYNSALPVMEKYAKACTLLGPCGAGQLTKMVNQICIAGLVQGLSEGLHFAKKAGLDQRKVISAISKGAAQSWQMENRSETMIRGEFEHGFAVDWMRKDLGICLETARQINATIPVAALVDQFYADVQNAGGNRFDTSSLITRLK